MLILGIMKNKKKEEKYNLEITGERER